MKHNSFLSLNGISIDPWFKHVPFPIGFRLYFYLSPTRNDWLRLLAAIPQILRISPMSYNVGLFSCLMRWWRTSFRTPAFQELCSNKQSWSIPWRNDGYWGNCYHKKLNQVITYTPWTLGISVVICEEKANVRRHGSRLFNVKFHMSIQGRDNTRSGDSWIFPHMN